MKGTRVIRGGQGRDAGKPWFPLRLTWAVSDELVEARHVCGGWFVLPAGAGSGWRGWPKAESAWYVTEGSLGVGWCEATGEKHVGISGGSFLYISPGMAVSLRAEVAAAGLVLFAGTPSPADLGVEAGSAAGGERPWIARLEDLPSDANYEPPLDMRWGVTDRLGGSRLLCGARTLDPPRGRIQHHYHRDAEAVIFFLRGAFRLFSGPEREPIDVGPGDVAYIPPGTLHSYCSLEAEGMAEEVAFYGGAANKEAAGTVFVEPPWSVHSGRGPVGSGGSVTEEHPFRGTR